MFIRSIWTLLTPNVAPFFWKKSEREEQEMSPIVSFDFVSYQLYRVVFVGLSVHVDCGMFYRL